MVVPPKSSILIGFSIINHPFWGIPIFGNTYIAMEIYSVPIANIFFANRQWSFLKSYVRFSEGNSSWICGMCSKKQGDEMVNIYYSCYDQNSKELNWESHRLFVSIHRSTLKLILRYQSLQTNKVDHTFLTQKWLHAKVIQKNSPQKPWWGYNLQLMQWKAILAIPSLGKGLVGFDTSPGSAKSLLVAPMAFYVAVGTKRAKEAFTKRMLST